MTKTLALAAVVTFAAMPVLAQSVAVYMPRLTFPEPAPVTRAAATPVATVVVAPVAADPAIKR